MFRLRAVVLLVGLGLFGATGGFGQEKKDPPKTEPKAKGFLPQNWGKLGLTDAQKQDVYKVQAKYRDEIDKLQAKIDDLKATQKKDMEKVLTDEQKKRLREILTGDKDK